MTDQEQKLVQKVALITGAAGGIGRAIARAYAQHGATVIGADIDASGLQKLTASITASGGCAHAFTCDVTDSTAVSDMLASIQAQFAGLHIVVCGTASFTPLATLAELDEEDWNRALAVNLTGAFLTCKYALPLIKNSGGGNIILIASQMGRVASENQATYCATKGALIQLAKGMALDHVKDNIRVNTLSPGGTATERLQRRFGDMASAQQLWGPKHPMGRLGEPDEIAAGAVFLASADSSFMTGADLLLDGGYSAW